MSMASSTIATDLLAEQSGEGPGNRGIPRSAVPKLSFSTEKSGEGPGQSGGIPRSVTGGKGIKRKKEIKTIENKYAAIMECEKGVKSKSEIARQFSIPPSTLSTWLKNKDNIKEGFQKFGPKRKAMRVGDHDELEEVLVKWFSNARSNNIPVSGPILQAKAEELAGKMCVEGFKSSEGWLDRFKQRHGISFKKVCGEANSVDTSSASMTAWKSKLQMILRQYQAEDVYNADETGIFYQMLPDRTMEFKNVQCHGGKQSKQRLTALVCANLTGTDKRPLFILGKSAKPCCFKNVKSLPTEYKSNKKAWMTSELFEAWVRDFDRKMSRRGRKVALVVDNCPAHPDVKGLKSVELVFLPPNTTSMTQPMDQGVIHSLKRKYRNRVLYKTIRAIDAGRTPSVNVYDALEMLQQAWGNVTATTISNGFRKAGFSDADGDANADADANANADKTVVEDQSDEDPFDDIPLAKLRLLGLNEESARDFLTLDDNLPTSMEITDEDIIEDVTSRRHTGNDDDDDDEPEENPETPAHVTYSADQLLDACTMLRNHFRTKENASDFLKSLCHMSDDIAKDDIKKCSVQTVITSFFK